MDEFWRTCKETGKTYETYRAFLNNLRPLKMTSKEYYDKHHRKENEGICYCGNETNYYSFSYSPYCSMLCCNKSKEKSEIIKNRFKDKPEVLQSFREKRIAANIDWSKSIIKRQSSIKEKCDRLGITEFDYYSEHSKNGHKTITPEKKLEYLLKRLTTIEERGFPTERSQYKKYEFFDKQVALQGYEPIVLETLIEYCNLGILNKEDVKIGKSNIPIFDFVNKEGKQSRYFPDFYISNCNLILEIKSRYTMDRHYENNMLKFNAVVDKGYSILVLVLQKEEARNRKLDGSKKLLDWAISSQAPNPIWYGEGSTTIRKE